MEGDKVRLGLNIPGRGVGGEERCTEMLKVGKSTSGRFPVRLCHGWLIRRGMQRIHNMCGQCLKCTVLVFVTKIFRQREHAALMSGSGLKWALSYYSRRDDIHLTLCQNVSFHIHSLKGSSLVT